MLRTFEHRFRIDDDFEAFTVTGETDPLLEVDVIITEDEGDGPSTPVSIDVLVSPVVCHPPVELTIGHSPRHVCIDHYMNLETQEETEEGSNS